MLETHYANLSQRSPLAQSFRAIIAQDRAIGAAQVCQSEAYLMHQAAAGGLLVRALLSPSPQERQAALDVYTESQTQLGEMLRGARAQPTKRCALCDKTIPADWLHASCSKCIDGGKLL